MTAGVIDNLDMHLLAWKAQRRSERLFHVGGCDALDPKPTEGTKIHRAISFDFEDARETGPIGDADGKTVGAGERVSGVGEGG